MAEVKNKVVTVESLAAVNTHNKNTYMAKSNPSGNGTLSMSGDGSFTGGLTVNSLTIGKAVLNYNTAEDALKISFLA